MGKVNAETGGKRKRVRTIVCGVLLIIFFGSGYLWGRVEARYRVRKREEAYALYTRLPRILAIEYSLYRKDKEHTKRVVGDMADQELRLYPKVANYLRPEERIPLEVGVQRLSEYREYHRKGELLPIQKR